ncbi:MAG: hypothetical protein MHM6MM_003597 [Cercozoa sp. M6MM]
MPPFISDRQGNDEAEPRKLKVRHLDDFVQMKCAPDLLLLGVFPDAKEISESVAAFKAARFQLRKKVVNFNDPKVTCVVVGDGSTPRCGALFAFRTKWRIISVDPQMRQDPRWSNGAVRRLEVRRCKMEDMVVEDCEGTVVFVALHAHVDLDEVLKHRVRWREEIPLEKRAVAVMAMPCCNFIESQSKVFGFEPQAQYEDLSVFGGQRNMRVWENVNLNGDIDIDNKR